MEAPKKIRTRDLFRTSDEGGRGRLCMVTSGVLTSIISWISTGLFYTGFMSAYGIDIVGVGIIAFIPAIANCFSVFSPSILERFRRRKAILAAARMAYYTLNLLGVTVMPTIVTDPSARMNCFIGIVFAANIINALFSGGYSVWHLNFLPVEVRAEYFSLSTTVTAFMGLGASLLASIAADALAGSENQLKVIILLRIGAYVLGVIDTIVLSLPKEYPYRHSGDRPKLTDIIVKPIKHPRFALTMLIVASYTFTSNITPSPLNYYLLNTVGVEYTLISAVNFCYPFILILTLPLWKKVLRRLGWLRTFALGEALHIPTTLLYSCIGAGNYFWILPAVRLTQHVIGVARNVAYQNMLYINMPKSDQTNYVSFHTLAVNISAFLGTSLGTWLIAAFPDLDIRLFGISFCNVQALMWIEALGQLITPLLLMVLIRKLTPPEGDGERK